MLRKVLIKYQCIHSRAQLLTSYISALAGKVIVAEFLLNKVLLKISIVAFMDHFVTTSM